MEQTKLKALELNAAKARLYGVQMVHDAASGHPGGSMSCMDVLTYLYFAEMRVDPKNPHDPSRDRFVMSKGHCSPAMYPVLALRGFFPVEDLKMFRRIDGHMSGHVEMKYVPGVDMSTGSLGQGISVAVGMALAGKVAQKDYRVYAILGDGEVAEGQVWEAMMAANKYLLDNLCACVDVNGLQIDGETKDVMPTEPLDKKFEAFGWHVIKIDGHDVTPLQAIEEMNRRAGAQGIGRIDLIEDRLVGIKSRELYEAPGAVALITAHQELENCCLEREQHRIKRDIDKRWAELVYDAQWFSPATQSLNAFIEDTQKYVSGEIRMVLHGGRAVVTGRRSDSSLYDYNLATYDSGDSFDQKSSNGFIDIYGLPSRVAAARDVKFGNGIEVPENSVE